ncbi:MAG: hypothetical protein KDI36_13680 [Pseudomonadales bacterium]|nr:hypothetical protein [Pseudomonadales bacterium]
MFWRFVITLTLIATSAAASADGLVPERYLDLSIPELSARVVKLHGTERLATGLLLADLSIASRGPAASEQFIPFLDEVVATDKRALVAYAEGIRCALLVRQGKIEFAGPHC